MPVTGAKQLETAAPFGWLKGKIWGPIFANFSFLRNGTLLLSHKECNKKSERIWKQGSSHSSHRSGLYIFDRKPKFHFRFVFVKSIVTICPSKIPELDGCIHNPATHTTEDMFELRPMPNTNFVVLRGTTQGLLGAILEFSFLLYTCAKRWRNPGNIWVNLKNKWCHTRSPEKGSDLIWWFHPGWWHRSPSRNIFWGLNFVKDDDSFTLLKSWGCQGLMSHSSFRACIITFIATHFAIVFFPTRHWNAFKQRKRYQKQRLEK